LVEANFAISAGSSIFFDATVILASEEGAKDLATQATAVDWVSNAFAHL
jgi:catalase